MGTILDEDDRAAPGDTHDVHSLVFAANRLLATFSPSDRALVSLSATPVILRKGQILWEPGDSIGASYFPAPGLLISIALDLQDGNCVDVATIGKEGAAGGIVSCGSTPAFGRATVQIGGTALRIDLAALESAKARSPHIRSVFCRYADALLAQVMQSVACNASHSLEARLCRWLLTSLDRTGSSSLALTQSVLAEMLGAQRTTVSALLKRLESAGVVALTRGLVQVDRRDRLEALTCECYAEVERHFQDILPPIKPQKVADSSEAASK